MCLGVAELLRIQLRGCAGSARVIPGPRRISLKSVEILRSLGSLGMTFIACRFLLCKKNEGPSDKEDGKLTIRPTTGTVQSLRTSGLITRLLANLLGFPTDALRQLR